MKFQRGGKSRDKNKSLYSREDSSSDEEANDVNTDFEPNKILFMFIDNHNEIMEQGEEGFDL